MKKLFYLFLLIISVQSFGQTPARKTGFTQFFTNNQFNRVWSDSVSNVAVKDTTSAAIGIGERRLKITPTDTLEYVWTGQRWKQSGSKAIDTTPLHNQIIDLQNNKVNISDTVNKWIGSIYKRSDSLFYKKGSTEVFIGRDSVGTGGGVTDGNKVGVTVSSSGTVWRINDGAVSIGQLADTVDFGGSGQSNLQGGALNCNGVDTTARSNFQVYDSTCSCYHTAYVGQSPFENPNSPTPLWFVGKRLATEFPNKLFRLHQDGQGATTIDSGWHDGVSVKPVLQRFINNCTASGISKLAFFVFIQGEAIITSETRNGYLMKQDSMIAVLRRQSWFGKNVPIAIVGMPDFIAAGDSTTPGHTAVDFWKKYSDWDGDVHTGYVPTLGLSLVNPSSYHYDAPGQKDLADRIIKVVNSLPHGVGDERNLEADFMRTNAGNYSIPKVGVADSLGWDYKMYGGGAGRMRLNMTSFGYNSMNTRIGDGINFGHNNAPNATGSNLMTFGELVFNGATTLSTSLGMGAGVGLFWQTGSHNLLLATTGVTNATSGSNNVIIGVNGIGNGYTTLNNNLYIGGGISGSGSESNYIRVNDGQGRIGWLRTDTYLNSFGKSATTATATMDLWGNDAGAPALRLRSQTTPSAHQDGGIWYDGTHFYGRIGSTSYQLDQQGGGGGGGTTYVDSIWRVDGKDSIFFRINGYTFKIKDSTGGSGGFTVSNEGGRKVVISTGTGTGAAIDYFTVNSGSTQLTWQPSTISRTSSDAFETDDATFDGDVTIKDRQGLGKGNINLYGKLKNSQLSNTYIDMNGGGSESSTSGRGITYKGYGVEPGGAIGAVHRFTTSSALTNSGSYLAAFDNHGADLVRVLKSGVVEYVSNYGSSFDSRSLVDKGYVDSVASTISGGGGTPSYIVNGDVSPYDTLTVPVSSDTLLVKAIRVRSSDGTVTVTKTVSPTHIDYDLSIPVLASGTYTPTLSNGSNVASSTTYSNVMYTRVGSVVTVSGKVTVTPTASGATSWDLSLPVSTANFADDGNAAGTGHYRNGTSQGTLRILANTGFQTAKFVYLAPDTALADFSFTFQYTIQ